MLNTKHKNRNKIIFVILAILIITFSNFVQKQIREFFYFISSPIQKPLWRAGDRASDFLWSFFNTKNLKQEKERLENENQNLIFKISALQEIKKENETLRQALGIELQENFNLEISQIINKDVSAGFILIDKGLLSGISKDMPIITGQNVLIGKISQVYDNFSEVMLVSNHKSVFDAKISSPDNDVTGIIRGQGSYSYALYDLIPRGTEISTGETIITSGLGGFLPKGLIIGKIKEVRKSDVDPFQQAKVELFFNISSADNIFVIKSLK
ncbi:MAG: rod shape-determining protein MreC [Candidatus Nealsonbacteria bacterium RIFCSPLOWO2_12_FULL_39_31]|uniref:Cell shape-determining protein MreC n=3 Tax=Candidatus Nealsoniibacteriota TaxID=1817911 RepID=A0A1G2EFD2_9BACT|nr:MAG: Cell shape-determining protein MreC [Parcubacteria group bacterium GW2011_GWA2_38_27]OGZ19549.1 MAG: rod shape-determining protein MreC [Candidatus Nealsonbacteria bacterium RIFCSPHIGHO2_01_FULL_38_55]OGZ20925.1 MAG: rod shape-determining protein MreC [Candidatus Nealsonbacteria bacterium RIFCSPHIGHO2_02_FULL_38_75]OGZ23776.1 MAG: rod shape-determining protein MreC [Candidatus Nealsonbacteria bacterium RIFCSPLOWO2_01_FULL_38_120]OGZ24499.1 MAG: rod shape-determining protein MreC [Candid